MNMENKSFQIHIELGSINGFPLVAIDGECDAFTAPFTHGAVSSLIDAGYTGIIVDIANLRYIDGAGFSALESCCTKINNVNGMLVLVSPGPNIENIFDLLRGKESCAIERTVEDALEKLKQYLK